MSPPYSRGSWCGCMSHVPQTMGVTRGGCTCLLPIPLPGPVGWVDARVLSLPHHRILQGECRCPSHPKPKGLGAFVVSPQYHTVSWGGCMCHIPTQTTGSHELGTCAPCPSKLQDLRGWMHVSALPGSNRAGVQVLCLTPPKPQDPMELSVHDFPLPQTKWPHGVGACACPPHTSMGWVCLSTPPPHPSRPSSSCTGGSNWGPTPHPGVGGLPRRGRFRGGGRLQEASL